MVATGGGAWVDPENRRRLRGCYRLVVLHAPLEVLRARVGDDPSRPLWAEAEARLADRAQAYADADLAVETSDLTVEDVVSAIVEGLEALP